jgi:hypothetical protein
MDNKRKEEDQQQLRTGSEVCMRLIKGLPSTRKTPQSTRTTFVVRGPQVFGSSVFLFLSLDHREHPHTTADSSLDDKRGAA